MRKVLKMGERRASLVVDRIARDARRAIIWRCMHRIPRGDVHKFARGIHHNAPQRDT